MSDTTRPTREEVRQALHAIDDKDSDFVVYPIRWPWNHLIAAARLWLQRTEPRPDEDVTEAPPGSRSLRRPLPLLAEISDE